MDKIAGLEIRRPLRLQIAKSISRKGVLLATDFGYTRSVTRNEMEKLGWLLRRQLIIKKNYNAALTK